MADDVFRPGLHKIRNGLQANVTKMQTGHGVWVLSGYIKNQNVCYCHNWFINGVSLSAVASQDLIERIKEKETA